MGLLSLQRCSSYKLLLACSLSLTGSLLAAESVVVQEAKPTIDEQPATDPLPGAAEQPPRLADPAKTDKKPRKNPFRRQNELPGETAPQSPATQAPGTSTETQSRTQSGSQRRTRATPASISSRSSSQTGNRFSPRLARVPYIMGDFFGRPHTTASIHSYYSPHSDEMVLPNPSAGDIVGRVRLQDNNSPLPRDRIYFDYSYFHNVPMTSAGIGVNRFSPGIEKTFWDGKASVELRVPMASTLNTNIAADLPDDTSHAEFGNLMIAPKFLLTSTSETALAAGLGVALPTADNIEVGLADGTRLFSVTNDSVHLVPYVAFLYTPEHTNFFTQVFLSFDFDTSGNPVHADTNGTGLERMGTWQDQNLAALSVTAGSWLYKNDCRNSRLKSISWSAEVHYTSTLNDADTLSSPNFALGDRADSLSLVNGTIGAHARIEKTMFTVGYSTPFTSNDRVFDGELRFFINRPF
jgi:hypothetical protein